MCLLMKWELTEAVLLSITFYCRGKNRIEKKLLKGGKQIGISFISLFLNVKLRSTLKICEKNVTHDLLPPVWGQENSLVLWIRTWTQWADCLGQRPHSTILKHVS